MTFQRMVNTMLQEAKNYAVAYLNDQVIYSTNWSEHLVDIWLVLWRLKGARLTAKYQLSLNQWVYYDHMVGNDEVCPEAT